MLDIVSSFRFTVQRRECILGCSDVFGASWGVRERPNRGEAGPIPDVNWIKYGYRRLETTTPAQLGLHFY